MARIIPNDNSFIAFTTTAPGGSGGAHTVTTDLVDGATNLTGFVISLNASSQGNVVPTPALDSLFETSIIGTSTATFTADFYRDDASDTAWDTLTRGTTGYFLVSRYGGAGELNKPIADDIIEVWPVTIVSRTSAAMSNNTVQTFTVTGSVPVEPTEAVTVTAGTGVPGVPTNLTATAASATSIVLDWDAPVGSAVTSYKVYQSSTLGGSYTEVTSNIVKAGTTATVSSLTAATAYFFKVAAVNASGTGTQTAAKTATTPAS